MTRVQLCSGKYVSFNNLRLLEKGHAKLTFLKNYYNSQLLLLLKFTGHNYCSISCQKVVMAFQLSSESRLKNDMHYLIMCVLCRNEDRE